MAPPKRKERGERPQTAERDSLGGEAEPELVAVIGPNAEVVQFQGGGSARVKAHRPLAILHELRSRGLDVEFLPGCSIAKRLPALRGEVHVDFTDATGATVGSLTADRLAFLWQDAPAPGVDHEALTIGLNSAELVPPVGRASAFELKNSGTRPLMVKVGRSACCSRPGDVANRLSCGPGVRPPGVPNMAS